MGKIWCNDWPWRMIQTNLRETDMADMDAAQYVDELKKFHATVVMINTAGIIASYKTGLPYQSQSGYLTGDSLEMIIDACHKEGIRVIARTDFSKVRRPVYEEHPEWAYRTADGRIVDYNGDVHVCPNGGYQQEYSLKIIEEVVEKLDIDGIFCNMSGFQVKDYSYNYYGICHCANCKRLFRERFGLELPLKEDMRDPVYRKYKVFQRECTEKQHQKLLDLMRKLNPDIAVKDVDFGRMESNTEYKRALPQWQYSASSNTRCIRGTGETGIVPSNTTVDFIGFYYRQVGVSPTMQELRMWQNVANLGGVDYYLIGRLDNHMDRSGYEGIKKVFRFHKEHETLLQGLHSCAKVLLVRRELWSDSKEERGWIRALTENHILFDEIQKKEFADADLSGYQMVLLPDIRYLSDQEAHKLDHFSGEGGTVLATGQSGFYTEDYEARNENALECMGMGGGYFIREDMVSSMLLIQEDEKKIFRHFQDTELVAIGDQFVFTQFRPGVETYLSLIPPHPIGPPERCYYEQVTKIPGIVRAPFGKGSGVFIPWLAGEMFYEGGYDNTMMFMKDVLEGLCGLISSAPGLTPMVEVTAGTKKGCNAVFLVNTTGHFGTSFYQPVPVMDVQVTIDTDFEPESVRTLNSKDNVEFRYENGRVTFTVKKLEAFEMIVMEGGAVTAPAIGRG